MRVFKNVSLFILASLLSLSLGAQGTLQTFAETDKPAVKRSISNYCHGLDTRYYKATEKGYSHDTYAECFVAGGTLPETTRDPDLLAQFADYKNRQKILSEQTCITSDNAAEREKACTDAALSNLQKNEAESKSDQFREFYGFNLGAAIAFTRLNANIIDDATISENGIVNVNASTSNRASVMFEGHHFFEKDCTIAKTACGHGPFFAVSITDDQGSQPLSSYGFGYMVGFKKDNEGGSWNFGVGVFVNTKAKVLRDGVEDNTATDLTDPTKLTVLEDKAGPMLIFSSSF